MTELRDLYQDLILDHGRSPRNFRVLADANRKAEGFNPLCGDRLTLYLLVDDAGSVRDASFQGSGCAISKASASLMSAAVKGKTVAQVEELFRRFHALVTGEPGGDAKPESLGKLAAFAGVREFPTRVKCASLPWHTLHAALHGEREPATTE